MAGRLSLGHLVKCAEDLSAPETIELTWTTLPFYQHLSFMLVIAGTWCAITTLPLHMMMKSSKIVRILINYIYIYI